VGEKGSGRRRREEGRGIEGEAATRTYEFLPALQPSIDLVLVEDVPTGKDSNDLTFLEVFEADGAL